MEMVSLEQKGTRKMGEQINNKGHMCQSLIHNFKGDTAKCEVRQMWLPDGLRYHHPHAVVYNKWPRGPP